MKYPVVRGNTNYLLYK